MGRLWHCVARGPHWRVRHGGPVAHGEPYGGSERVVGELAGEDGGGDGQTEGIVEGGVEDVLIEDGQIGVHPDRESAAVSRFAECEPRACGVHPEPLGDADAVLRVPAAGRVAVPVDAPDGGEQ